ncbi:uncharacterized protein UDID_06228 [Ustilago sp. UG-2017a]|nr:uncharacterized protein UDID_06228 [Ustilago sp. UG-2017a]
MPPFTTSFGRLPSIRKRETKNKSVKPIDVDAAKQYQDARPSSAAFSSLLTPRPHHYPNTSPSPSTPAASSSSSFASSGSRSSRIVSSPTFVSSSALSGGHAFPGDQDSLTPPLSPVAPHSPDAAQATKSPLRRALSRSLFFHSPPPQISLPLPVAWHIDQPRPARPARPAISPATGLSPNPNAFGFTPSPMTRSPTSSPTITTATTSSSPSIEHLTIRTLMPPATIPESKLSSSQRSLSPTWSKRSSRSASPLPIAKAAPSPSSLRSIRQMHARKSIHSIFALSSSAGVESTPMLQDVSIPPTFSRRLSFQCRGPHFDSPPAADIRQLHTVGFYTRPTAAVSMYSSSHPSSAYGYSGARHTSDLTRSTYQELNYDMLSETDNEAEPEIALAGLGLIDPLPAVPRVMPKRLSATSQISLAESVPSSVHSSSSTLSLSSLEQQFNSSWPALTSKQNWFSACPPTPPSSIRLQLDFRSLPPRSPAALFSSTLAPNTTTSTTTSTNDDDAQENKKPDRPLSGIFISSNSSVLDLKETIASRMCESGYRLSPKNLTLTLHLNEDVRTNSRTALGLKLSAYGKNPAKVLDDSSRLLFEEGAQEEDLVVVDCDPSHILWSI